MKILYPSCTLSLSLSHSDLFHQQWSRVKDLAGRGEVLGWTSHRQSNGKSRGENNLSKLQSSECRIDSFRTRFANVWIHAMEPITRSLRLHLSTRIDCDTTPSYQLPNDSSFSTKWAHTLKAVCCSHQDLPHSARRYVNNSMRPSPCLTDSSHRLADDSSERCHHSVVLSRCTSLHKWLRDLCPIHSLLYMLMLWSIQGSSLLIWTLICE